MKINKSKWKYVVSEIAIVSVGILIAFFINNWSSNIKKNNTFKEYKSGLTIDLEKNIENLDRIIDAQQLKVNSLNEVMSLITDNKKGDLSSKQLENISKTLLKQRKSPTFFPITGTFKALVSHGEIDLFSINVKRNLFNLYDTNYERTVYNGNLYDKIYVDVYDKLIHSVIDLRLEKIIDSQQLYSKDFSRDIFIIIDEADSYLGLAKSTKDESAKVLALIKNKS